MFLRGWVILVIVAIIVLVYVALRITDRCYDLSGKEKDGQQAWECVFLTQRHKVDLEVCLEEGLKEDIEVGLEEEIEVGLEEEIEVDLEEDIEEYLEGHEIAQCFL